MSDSKHRKRSPSPESHHRDSKRKHSSHKRTQRHTSQSSTHSKSSQKSQSVRNYSSTEHMTQHSSHTESNETIPSGKHSTYSEHLQSTQNTQQASKPIVKDWYPYCVVYDPIQVGSIDGTDTIPHDRAIIRALNSTYTPNNSLKTDPKHTLFVGRLNKNTTEHDLSRAFEKFGNVRDVKLIRDVITGMSKRYAFIEFENERPCVEAIRGMNKSDFQGAEIIVDFEAGRTLKGWKPRRLGGGFGGNKNSGQLRFGGRNRPWVKPVQLMNEEELRAWRRTNGGER
uniref:U11/U12 small nuclear ribonucleoprotein 35 kDa protein n=1 Tax=Cacopsylla melanoneura TaxID=428564 RepID=A0A8D8YKH9_9HEMI